nr:hypothetical protein [Tanacetum cinerariifolium]
MANSNNPYAFLAPHQDQSSLNQNYLQQPMQNPEDIMDPTTAMNMALALMAKAFKLNILNSNQQQSENFIKPKEQADCSTGYEHGSRQTNADGWRVQNVGNSNGLMGVQGNGNQNQIGNVNANCILMANLQQASTSGTQSDSTPIYDTDGSRE